ncbi:NAD-dependent epimerase/dehydratase family protein [Streptomyces sp. NPDC001935]
MTVLITGAAGFIGSHAVCRLLATDRTVVATDMVAPAEAERLTDLLEHPRLRYVPGDLFTLLPDLLEGIDEVWHLAANADIPLGARDTEIDLRQSAGLTRHVLEAMRTHGVTTIVFPSTSGVYGDRLGPLVTEADGPLLPNSLYAAGKVASEALISAYCAMFGLRARIYRLGNVLGGRMGRGIVRDFLRKLQENPAELHVLGDGRQRKSYVLIDDIVAGMDEVTRATEGPGHPACEVYNLAAGGSVDTAGVAALVARALDLDPPTIRTDEAALSWSGDQPVIELSIDKVLSTGWRPRHTAEQSVLEAARRMLAEQRSPATTGARA